MATASRTYAPPGRLIDIGGLEQLSSHTTYVTAAGSGHEIHLYQPDAVVQALDQGVRAPRNASHRPVR